MEEKEVISVAGCECGGDVVEQKQQTIDSEAVATIPVATGEMVKVDACGPDGNIISSFVVEGRALQHVKSKVCIVGCADSKKIVPWSDPDMEFWGVNNLYGVQLDGAHYDRWFEIHNIELSPADGKYRRREDILFRGQKVDEYLKGIAAMDCPLVYMQKKWDLIPQSVEYPIGLITALFGRYLTNTISYEIALAIAMNFKEIHIYGVDMAVGCLAPETRVLTADRQWIPCAEVREGYELVAFDENPDPGALRYWQIATVKSNPQITKPCYRLTFGDGKSIIASENHGWLTANGWVTTKELASGINFNVLNIHWLPERIATIEFIGEQIVMGLETSAKTYIAEGLLSHNSEYAHQRPSCEFFIGFATGKGIKVVIPDEADLLKARFLYGFEEPKRKAWDNKVRAIQTDLAKKREQAAAQMEASKTAYNQYVGAEYAIKELDKIWGSLDDVHPSEKKAPV